jgi:hypothetical protein
MRRNGKAGFFVACLEHVLLRVIREITADLIGSFAKERWSPLSAPRIKNAETLVGRACWRTSKIQRPVYRGTWKEVCSAHSFTMLSRMTEMERLWRMPSVIITMRSYDELEPKQPRFAFPRRRQGSQDLHVRPCC